MIQSVTSPKSNKTPIKLLLALLLGTLLCTYLYQQLQSSQPYVYATAASTGALAFSYEIITTDLEVDWTGGGDFDPKDKCPKDFLGEGFIVVCKKLADGAYVKFLYHKGKQMLYRIDKDVIKDKVMIGLHWVTGTRYNAKYRIADKAFKGGKNLQVPNAKGGTDVANFRYGEAVSKKRVQPGRELFRETHIFPGQCQSWWDIFNFMP